VSKPREGCDVGWFWYAVDPTAKATWCCVAARAHSKGGEDVQRMEFQPFVTVLVGDGRMFVCRITRVVGY
jgi:hypothetical protein